MIIVLHFTNKYEYDEYEPVTLHKKIKFFIKDFFSKFLQLTSTEEILNGKLHFLYSVKSGTQNQIIELKEDLFQAKVPFIISLHRMLQM